MAIQAVSFGQKAVTKSGNEYERTSKATKIGAGIGLGYGLLNSGVAGYKMATKNPPKKVKNQLLNTYKNLRQSLYFSPEEAKNVVQRTAKAGVAIGLPVNIAVSTLIGLGIGAAVNKIINHKRAAKADAVANALVK